MDFFYPATRRLRDRDSPEGAGRSDRERKCISLDLREHGLFEDHERMRTEAQFGTGRDEVNTPILSKKTREGCDTRFGGSRFSEATPNFGSGIERGHPIPSQLGHIECDRKFSEIKDHSENPRLEAIGQQELPLAKFADNV